MTNAHSAPETSWPRLRQMLERQGRMVRGITRTVRASTCPTCHAPTLTGLDADTTARPCTVDPIPLDQLGELLAIAAGRYTVTLRQVAGRFELDYRDSFHIAGSPATTQPVDVLAEHRCVGPPLPVAATAYPTKPRQAQEASCPF